MLCCCENSDLDDFNESYAPPNIQKRTKIQQEPQLIKQSQHIRQTDIQPLQFRKKYLSNDRMYVSPIPLRQGLFPQQKNSQIYPSRIDSLRNQLRNSKISLSRKRNDFTSRFKVLQSRVHVLKNSYVQKEYKMNDLTQRINHLLHNKKQRNVFQHPNNFLRVQR